MLILIRSTGPRGGINPLRLIQKDSGVVWSITSCKCRGSCAHVVSSAVSYWRDQKRPCWRFNSDMSVAAELLSSLRDVVEGRDQFEILGSLNRCFPVTHQHHIQEKRTFADESSESGVTWGKAVVQDVVIDKLKAWTSHNQSLRSRAGPKLKITKRLFRAPWPPEGPQKHMKLQFN